MKKVLNKKIYTEEERIQFSNGQCFGEWAIIRKAKRSGSAYTLTPCDLFYLDKEEFEKHFSKCISKAENDRKEFLSNCFPFMAGNIKLDEHYQKIVPLFLNKNDIDILNTDIGKYGFEKSASLAIDARSGKIYSPVKP